MDYATLPHPDSPASASLTSSVSKLRRVVGVGLSVTIVMVMLQTLSQAIDFGAFDLRIWAFNADKHYSVFGVASLMAQAAVAAAAVWRVGHVERLRWAWGTLGAILGALVIVRGLTTFNASLLAAPLAAVFLLICWLTWRDRGARGVVWAGLFLMAISLLLHKVGLASDASTASDYTWAYQITGMVKHGAELAGWMLVATGIIAGGAAPQLRSGGAR